MRYKETSRQLEKAKEDKNLKMKITNDKKKTEVSSTVVFIHLGQVPILIKYTIILHCT